MLVYIDDREDEEYEKSNDSEENNEYGYDYGNEELSYEYTESDEENNYFS